jgi:hypothetical protein
VERDEEGKEESSFSEEKEAKRLFTFAPGAAAGTRARSEKFFGSFFQKRTRLLAFLSSRVIRLNNTL